MWVSVRGCAGAPGGRVSPGRSNGVTAREWSYHAAPRGRLVVSRVTVRINAGGASRPRQATLFASPPPAAGHRPPDRGPPTHLRWAPSALTCPEPGEAPVDLSGNCQPANSTERCAWSFTPGSGPECRRGRPRSAARCARVYLNPHYLAWHRGAQKDRTQK